MSIFGAHTRTQYANNLRAFLGMRPNEFYALAGIEPQTRRGVVLADAKRRIPAEAVVTLEIALNCKARRSEDSANSFGERITYARDYAGHTDTSLARELGVSRTTVVQWRRGPGRPCRLAKLASALNVPTSWLAEGKEEDLPANSRIGARVGYEAGEWRETLFGLTLASTACAPQSDDLSVWQVWLEEIVFERPAMALAARRAGGRWQRRRSDGNWVFAAWEPLRPLPRGKHAWSIEVDELVDDALASYPSIQQAWPAPERRCGERGLPCPSSIALFKCVERRLGNEDKFGVDLNDELTDALRRQGKL